jgi:uncharacterized protein (TIGR02246 family)
MLLPRIYRPILGAALIGSIFGGPVQAQAVKTDIVLMEASSMTQDEAAIRHTLAAYNAALNGGDARAVLPLYTTDGICMAPFSPPSIGQPALEKAYQGFFREMKFDVAFDIAEVVVLAPDWAYVRTSSAGTTLHRSSGKTVSEANQELFVMRRDGEGRWRIARYSFSPTNPPRS